MKATLNEQLAWLHRESARFRKALKGGGGAWAQQGVTICESIIEVLHAVRDGKPIPELEKPAERMPMKKWSQDEIEDARRWLDQQNAARDKGKNEVPF